MANRSRKNELKVYLSDEEQEILDRKIKQAGIVNKSAYVRKMLCDGAIINVDLSLIKNHNREISKIGNNLNQIAKQLNGLNYIDPEDVKRYPSYNLVFLPNCYFGETDFTQPSEIDLLYIGQFIEKRHQQFFNNMLLLNIIITIFF